MLLTSKEKKHLLKVLKRDQYKWFQPQAEKEKSKELYDKIKQTIRNEKINEDKQSSKL
ncbi:hypothetical protein ATL39_0312 [Sinobaca qinghaiensis]|uniref:Uncharacterized protein n=1 Tax=Sinobaca qinghaiensis TaxID=342944 RepID=A0A419V7T4_9BACL|nr:hypothetical protein [Sinobaca qinghaiensis]RKD76100.1 hypothetical protein ATL39_0312 [Sinobaca qinghaiensis]